MLSQPADKQDILQVVKGEELEDDGEELVGEPRVDAPARSS